MTSRGRFIDFFRDSTKSHQPIIRTSCASPPRREAANRVTSQASIYRFIFGSRFAARREMTSFDDVRKRLDEMTEAGRSNLLIKANTMVEDTREIIKLKPEQRGAYVFKIGSLIVFLIIKARLALYGVDLLKAVPYLDITNRPITKLRLHHIVAFCVYEYDQSLCTEEKAKRGITLYNHIIGVDPTIHHLAMYAHCYVQACMPLPCWRVEISYKDTDGIDDLEEAKDRLDELSLHPSPPVPVIPARQF